MSRRPFSAQEKNPEIDVLKAEMFSFGLLVSYILLERDLFRVPAIANFLAAKYFGTLAHVPGLQTPEDITNCNISELANHLLCAQQWMISDHLNTFSRAVCQAIRELAMPQETIDAMVHFVNKSLDINPSERPNFRDACVMIGGNPDEKRCR